ncbi:ornithine cyclodeaminase family protein [Haloarchaeobius sp. HME9146]|uniref:ornithine cyclodeaminase family protein n=1 Tax=Haloarchaeobius sp. HME9146 TaxID=2978732 RepID=UPI0021C15082|nr:ornithine cyclodeaminase family protein [Haloarchaeobius sp. HME9146]MCT9095483.1 ornithine cyclodeaminase family protein [Haloarchaeobius sp. HME9146]
MQTHLLDGDDVQQYSPMTALVSAIEDAFAAYETGDAQMPPKSYIDLPQYNGDFRSMPAYMDAGDWDAAGIKWVNVHPDNPSEFDLPTVMGTMIYSDPETGFPLAIMDGTELTMRRTGAAAAVATDHLAVEDASSLGIVGAGVQSYTQVEAIAAVRDIEEVVVSDLDEARVAAFIDAFEDEFDVREGSIAEAASCDVLSTVTPVESPIVSAEDLGEHTHVNAMGADAEGKHELADEVLLNAKLVIDDYDQTTHSGEINVPFHEGVLGDDDIDGQIGEIVTGKIDGRTPEDGVTVFDSTGLAIQDVAAAHVVYEAASAEDEETQTPSLITAGQ